VLHAGGVGTELPEVPLPGSLGLRPLYVELHAHSAERPL
jgi:hypothetical protein